MTGNAWIIIGVLAAALAAFAIPYGFHRKSKERSITGVQVDGDYVAGQKVTNGGDYVAGDKITNIGPSYAEMEEIVRCIAKEFSDTLAKRYGDNYTVFGISASGLVVPKGLVPENIKVLWDTGKVHNISDDAVLIRLPDIIPYDGMLISGNVTPLDRRVGAKSGQLISTGGVSPIVEIIGIQGDLVVVALSFETNKQK